MLQITDIDSYYGASHILHGVGLEAGKGELVGILGRNGTGKTTLLRTIMGMTTRATGSLKLNGQELIGEPTNKRAFAGFGYVPQGRQIIPDFTIRENILMGRFAAKDGRKDIPEIVYEIFPYLIENLDRPGGVLSGGQQQQLAIARALATEPSVLLLDEPTEGIQPNIVEQIEKTIIRLNKELGLTILLVEQNIRFVRAAASRFVMMENGRSVATGATAALTEALISKHMTI